LTDGFFAAADPAISFDGTMVLFSAQKNASDPWQIWQVQTDGSAKLQLTNCAEDCTHPAYLPGDEIAFTVAPRQTSDHSSYLAVAKKDGSQVQRITFGPGDWRLETVLRDGRIVASASWPLTVSSESSANRLLYTLRPDGSGLDALRCDHGDSAIRREARELQDGSIVFVKQASRGQLSGPLAAIETGGVHETNFGAPGEKINSLQELTEETLIVSRTVNSGGAGRGGRLVLYLLDRKSKSIRAELFSNAQMNSLQPIAVSAHPVPKKFWSTLNPQAHSGYFIALNSYSSADETGGRVKTEITSVRVWTLATASTKEEMLGEAPVEKDGSFYVAVKADQPVRFELLAADETVIRAERGWIWSRPGEERGCAGCHSDKAVAPENRWPMTLKRFDTPTQLIEKEAAAMEAHGN
jgi:Hydrazine synthase alpha subunit middle domain